MDKNKCSSCGGTKCSCKNKDFTKRVIEIDNPEQITLMRRVVIPASMGDDTTVPPVVGKYKNVLLFYEANSKSYLYSSDGIPTQLVNGATDYEQAVNLPQINGVTLLGDKSSADLKLADAPVVVHVTNNNMWSSDKTSQEIYELFNSGVNVVVEFDERPSDEKTWPVLQLGYDENNDTLVGIIAIGYTELEETAWNSSFVKIDFRANRTVASTEIRLQEKLTAGDGIEIEDNTISISDIEQYAHFFDTVADMKAATNLKAGDYARTGGFHTINDGGGALYKITDTGTANEMDVIAVGNLYASLITGSTANALQFGAYGDGTHNDTTALQACADCARVNALKLYIPNKTFLTDTLTITEVKNIDIEGVIELSSGTQFVNILESTADYACNIYINRVNNGTILMKGLNTSDVRIQRAYRLTLLADNTNNHHWIAYSKFYLGFINELNILDDGSGTKYINENLFVGGRFVRINIGTGDSNYRHENNLFLKPLCEDTVLVADYARANIFQDARFEGNDASITWGENALANVVYQEWKETNVGYWFNKERINSNITVTDNSHGRNSIITNRGMSEELITNINVTNNPRNMVTDGDSLYPLQGKIVYESDYIPLPNIESALVFSSNETHYMARVFCYDANKAQITSDPQLMGDLSWPGVSWNSAQNRYNNTAYNSDIYIFMIKPSETVKYIKFQIFSLESGTRYHFDNIQVTLNSYGKMNPLIIDMAKKYTLPE